MYQALYEKAASLRDELCHLSDEIFDHPELGFQEVFASNLLTAYLEEKGFTVERGCGSLDTAFRAEYMVGDGSGASIGLLCEYDALAVMGHGCGHHMQGPGIIGAAVALKEVLPPDTNHRIVVYGTPAEEGGGGKIIMLEHGCFQDIDVAFMMHSGPQTCTDVRSLACVEATVTYYGKAAHAASNPEIGRSALDALMVAFNGVEFLREHTLDDTRVHYTIAELPGPANIVPAKAVGSFMLRSYNSAYLDKIILRFEDIVKGAGLIAGASYDLSYGRTMKSRVPVYALSDLLMKHAHAVNAPCLKPPRQKTGSTDFGNVTFEMPGISIRVAFVPEGASSHSKEFMDNGKAQSAHDAIVYTAQILAGAAYDLIADPALLQSVKEEFKTNKEAMTQA